jgi:hypothetical protein
MAQIAGYRFAHARLTPWPACQCPSPQALGPLGQCALPSVADAPGPLVSARPPAHAPSAADLISAVGFRSDG